MYDSILHMRWNAQWITRNYLATNECCLTIDCLFLIFADNVRHDSWNKWKLKWVCVLKTNISCWPFYGSDEQFLCSYQRNYSTIDCFGKYFFIKIDGFLNKSPEAQVWGHLFNSKILFYFGGGIYFLNSYRIQIIPQIYICICECCFYEKLPPAKTYVAFFGLILDSM